MSIRNAAGTAVTKATVVTNLGAAITQEARYTVDQFYYKDITFVGDRGSGAFERSRAILWVPGQVITQSQLDAVFPTATFTSITPATGLAAGGTPVTIKGTNLSGVTGVTFGGTAATAVKVTSDTTVTCTTPAKTAGAYNVVLADDAGNVTATNAYTYT